MPHTDRAALSLFVFDYCVGVDFIHQYLDNSIEYLISFPCVKRKILGPSSSTTDINTNEKWIKCVSTKKSITHDVSNVSNGQFFCCISFQNKPVCCPQFLYFSQPNCLFVHCSVNIVDTQEDLFANLNSVINFSINVCLPVSFIVWQRHKPHGWHFSWGISCYPRDLV